MFSQVVTVTHTQCLKMSLTFLIPTPVIIQASRDGKCTKIAVNVD